MFTDAIIKRWHWIVWSCNDDCSLRRTWRLLQACDRPQSTASSSIVAVCPTSAQCSGVSSYLLTTWQLTVHVPNLCSSCLGRFHWVAAWLPGRLYGNGKKESRTHRGWPKNMTYFTHPLSQVESCHFQLSQSVLPRSLAFKCARIIQRRFETVQSGLACLHTIR